jgi:biotin carboxyl carrier protein
MRYIADVDGRTYNVDVNEETREVRLEDQTIAADLQQVTAPNLFSLIKDGHSYEIFAEPADKGFAIRIAGRRYLVNVADERTLRLERVQRQTVERRGEMVVKAPMPGLVVAVLVAAGDTVKAGQSLLILMAMKMENELRSFSDGTVISVAVQKGDKVDVGQALLAIE